MVWRPDQPEGNEAAKIAPFIVPYTRGRGLDIGCGPYRAFPHFLPIDNGKGWQGQKSDHHWLKAEADDLSFLVDGCMDFVFSSHLLEHLEEPETALAEWWRVIRPGGHLVLYLPDASFYPRRGEDGANPDHKHDFEAEDIIGCMGIVCQDSGFGFDIVENERRNGGNEYSFFQVYRKHERVKGSRMARAFDRSWRKPPGRSCLVIRYGAIGDHMMASSALRRLKAEGWHVTYNCDPRGEELLRHDPHIDRFLVQDTDQVPNHLLGLYWRRLAERYDAVFNLSESVEGMLLAVPGRQNHGWSDDVRRRVMGTVNYLDRTHDLCGVARDARPEFFATDAEREWAGLQRPDGPVILYCLSGSAVHKAWPWMDNLIAMLMQTTGAMVVLAGAGLDAMLETGWDGPGSEERVHCMVGKWSQREVLAFAKHAADIVIGPETGVLNAVSHEPHVGKICLLSHSSHENLTRDWVNTFAVPARPEVACYPCHRMHYGFEFCHRDENTGAAACAASITPDAVMTAVMQMLQERSQAA